MFDLDLLGQGIGIIVNSFGGNGVNNLSQIFFEVSLERRKCYLIKG